MSKFLQNNAVSCGVLSCYFHVSQKVRGTYFLFVRAFKTKLSLNWNCCFAIRKCKTWLKMTYYQGKSMWNICTISDFWKQYSNQFLGVVWKTLLETTLSQKMFARWNFQIVFLYRGKFCSFRKCVVILARQKWKY